MTYILSINKEISDLSNEHHNSKTKFLKMINEWVLIVYNQLTVNDAHYIVFMHLAFKN
jgi:hypothetical protein